MTKNAFLGTENQFFAIRNAFLVIENQFFIRRNAFLIMKNQFFIIKNQFLVPKNLFFTTRNSFLTAVTSSLVRKIGPEGQSINADLDDSNLKLAEVAAARVRTHA